MIKFKVEGKNGFLILQGTDTTLEKQRKVAIPVSDIIIGRAENHVTSVPDSATNTVLFYWYGEASEVLSNYFFGE